MASHRALAQMPSIKASAGTSGRALHVAGAKKASKRCQAVLIQNVEKLGAEGDLVTVQQGYMFNYLLPQRLAQPATQEYLDAIKKKMEEENMAAQAVIDRAKSLATALQTIGTIKISKKVGDQNQIFGSVQPKEVASFIYQQTGQQIDEAKITLPEIKKLGTYDGSAKLHPEVTGNFKVQVVKQANK